MTDIGRLRLVDLASAHGVHGEHDIMVLLVADLLDDREAGADADRAVELVGRARSSTQRASDSGGHTSTAHEPHMCRVRAGSKGAGRGAEAATPRASHASHAELLATNDEWLDTGHARPATAPE